MSVLWGIFYLDTAITEVQLFFYWLSLSTDLFLEQISVSTEPSGGRVARITPAGADPRRYTGCSTAVESLGGADSRQ